MCTLFLWDTGREAVVLCELEMNIDLGRSQAGGKNQFGLQGDIRDSSFAGSGIKGESRVCVGFQVGKEGLECLGKEGQANGRHCNPQQERSWETGGKCGGQKIKKCSGPQGYQGTKGW